ncbi:MAG: hypothetical protein PHT94_04435 [Candidatus Nanoarchaeia archaeon]|nr:hypothetical protein [Candidatus Nanoarchaeia archaeon]
MQTIDDIFKDFFEDLSDDILRLKFKYNIDDNFSKILTRESFAFIEEYSNRYSKLLKNQSHQITSNIKDYVQSIKNKSSNLSENKNLEMIFIIEKYANEISDFFPNEIFLNDLKIMYSNNAIKFSNIVHKNPYIVKPQRSIIFYEYQRVIISNKKEIENKENKKEN